MQAQIEEIKKSFHEKLAQLNTMEELEKLRVEYLGKKGEFTKILRSMGSLTPEERPQMGKLVNEAKAELEEAKLMEQKQYDNMKMRIRFMYEMGDQNYFEILFTGKSIADSINKVEYVSELVSYDRKMMEKYKETKQLIADKESVYTTEQQELLTLKDKVNEQQQLIAQKISKTNENIKEYAQDISAAEAAALEYEKKVEANKSAIDEESRRIEEESILKQQKIEQASREQASREESIRNEHNGAEEEETTSPQNSGGSDYVPASSDLDMLAALIECEAGNQTYYGMLCVGAVVMNRINSSSFPNTLYDVLYQPYQFTPVTVSNRFSLVLARGANETCYKAAREVLEQGNIVGTWLFFRMNDGSRDGEVIGDHVFY